MERERESGKEREAGDEAFALEILGTLSGAEQITQRRSQGK